MSNNNDILMKTKAIALFLLGFIPAFAQDIPTSKTEQNMDRIERCKKKMCIRDSIPSIPLIKYQCHD